MTALATRARLLENIAGAGIEIGAYQDPLPVSSEARVTYVDLLTPEQSAEFFPENAHLDIVVPDIIAPAEDLAVFDDETQDFVLTSHLLEHLPDPLRGLKEWHRVLRPGGLLFLALPDKRHTFDQRRTRTTLDHVIADYQIGGDASARERRDFEHYRAWMRYVQGVEDPAQELYLARLLQRSGYPIHFHCWIPKDVLEMISWLREEGGAHFRLVDHAHASGAFEFAFLLQRA